MKCFIAIILTLASLGAQGMALGEHKGAPDVMRPVAVLPEKALQLSDSATEKMRQVARILGEVSDKQSADVAVNRLKPVLKEMKKLLASLNELDANVQEVTEDLISIELEETVILLKGIVDDLALWKFYDSENMEETLRENGLAPREPEHETQQDAEPAGPDEKQWRIALDLTMMMRGVTALCCTVKDHKSAATVAQKLRQCRLKWEETMNNPYPGREAIAACFHGMMGVIYTPHKKAQKDRLKKADFYGSAALKAEFEFWDKIIPDFTPIPQD